MIDVPIKNKEVLSVLDRWLWYYDNREDLKKVVRLHGKSTERDFYVGKKHRDEIIAMDTNHEGFPDSVHGYSLKSDRIEFVKGNNPENANYIAKFSELNTELCHILSSKNNALAQLYPPDGHISWHNNANASAYNIIFSWSETGDGCFKYVDGHTGNEVVMQDVKGWQCKAGYFGAYQEPWYKRVYHAAETDCWRMTISYIFNRSDMSHGLQDEIIEEIMSDF